MFEHSELDEIKRIMSERGDSLTSDEKDHLKGDLAVVAWDIGLLWDKLDGVDPIQGSQTQFTNYGGTPNHRSMTYKIRKLLGYSYP